MSRRPGERMRQDMEDMADMEDMVVVEEVMVVVEDMEEQGQSGSSLPGILLHTIIRRADFTLKIASLFDLHELQANDKYSTPAISYFSLLSISKHLKGQLGPPCVTNKCA